MPGTPCVRMHLANLSAARNWLPVAADATGASRSEPCACPARGFECWGPRACEVWSGRLLRSGRESSARRVRACNPRTRSQARKFASPSCCSAWPRTWQAATATTQLTAARLPPTLRLRASLTLLQVVPATALQRRNTVTTLLRPLGILAGASYGPGRKRLTATAAVAGHGGPAAQLWSIPFPSGQARWWRSARGWRLFVCQRLRVDRGRGREKHGVAIADHAAVAGVGRGRGRGSESPHGGVGSSPRPGH